MMQMLRKLKKILEFFPCDGVTTNPSILAKSGKAPYDVLSEIRKLIGKDGELHVQVVSKKAEAMMEEAKKIHNILINNGFNTKILAASFKNS